MVQIGRSLTTEDHEPMLSDILFIKALLAHFDLLVALLGDEWIALREKLLPLLTDVINEKDANKIAARAHRIMRAFQGTSGEVLTQVLFRQASEQVHQRTSRERIRGERAENLEQAIAHCQQALEVYTRQADPEQWARIQHNLANAYRERIRGERAENLEQAIAHCQQALEVYTRQADPERWAGIQHNLANAYLERIRGERAENLEQAVAHFQQAQEVEKRARSDTDFQATQRGLANLDFGEEHWPEAQSAYQDGGETDLKAAAEALTNAIRAVLMAGVKPSPTPESQTVTTHPNLLGNDYAYLSEPYRLVVKLSDQPQLGGAVLSAPELNIPVEEGEVVKKIQVKLTALDFGLDPSDTAEGWLRDLDFYPQAAASNAISFTLWPQDRFEDRYFAALRVQFALNGQVLGQAIRRIEVLRDEAIEKTSITAFPPPPGYPLDERGEKRVAPILTPICYRPDEPQVHLTLTLSEADQRDLFQWQIDSPYLKPSDYPKGEYYSRNLGVEEFVKDYLAPFGMPGTWPEDHMNESGCLKALSINILYNNLLTLRHCAPTQFWQLYTLALERHHAQGGTSEDFTVLFLTADTHVPWELMPVSEDASDGKVPPLLGSAHRVGRWLLDVGVPTPDEKLDLHGFSVAAPSYSNPPLPQAQKEKDFLMQHYQSQVLPDDANEFIAFMKTGQPSNGTGIFHFAGHGDCCTDRVRGNWLVLTNRHALYDINSASTDLGNRLGKLRPTLAFFNACSVGRAASGPLGSNGGWGRALLNQQYKGYIGPLWSVYDEHARDICEMFYSLALDEGLALGEVMRRIRARFAEDNRLFTYLAYLYLGHPSATITYTPFED